MTPKICFVLGSRVHFVLADHRAFRSALTAARSAALAFLARRRSSRRSAGLKPLCLPPLALLLLGLDAIFSATSASPTSSRRLRGRVPDSALERLERRGLEGRRDIVSKVKGDPFGTQTSTLAYSQEELEEEIPIFALHFLGPWRRKETAYKSS